MWRRAGFEVGAGFTKYELCSGNVKAVLMALQRADPGAGGQLHLCVFSKRGLPDLRLCSSADVGKSQAGGLDLERTGRRSPVVEDRPPHGESRGVPPEEGLGLTLSLCEEKQAKQTCSGFSPTLVVFRQQLTTLHIQGKSCSKNTLPHSPCP